MAYFEFPHTRSYDGDLGYIIKTIDELTARYNEFFAFNNIKFADPIQWDITRSYEAFVIVSDMNTNRSFLSRKAVPSGVDIDNNDYWLYIGYFTIDMVLSDSSTNPVANKIITVKINDMDSKISDNTAAINSESDTRAAADEAINAELDTLSDNLEDETTARTSADTLINARIDEIIEGASADPNAELLDIRVGADGVTYASAGAAVRTQFDDINSMLVKKATNNYGLGSNIMGNVTGNNNTGVGASALSANTSGASNVAVGASAGHTLTTGGNNTFVGYNADADTDSTSLAVGIGRNSKTGTGSVSVGQGAAATATYATAVGYGSTASTGNYSNAFGYAASATHRGSTAIGTDSNGAGAETTKTNQVVIGTSNQVVTIPGALEGTNTNSVTPNTTLGSDIAPALSSWSVSDATWATDHWSVSAGGYISTSIACDANATYVVQITTENALTENDTINPLTFTLGDDTISIFGANDANFNVALTPTSSGSLTLTIGGVTWSGDIKSVTVKKVTAYRSAAAKINSRNLSVNNTNFVFGNGQDKSVNTVGVNNISIGQYSQVNLDTGIGNVGIGYYTQNAIRNGSHNTAVGEIAQRRITTGMYNNAYGYAAQNSITSGCWNNAIGNEAQRDITTGCNNVALGRRAQNNIKDGNKNVAVGAQAGFYRDDIGQSVGTVHGSEQTYIGYQATQSEEGTINNSVAVGSHANAYSNATALGAYAAATASNTVAIGYNVSAVNENDFVLGNTSNRFILGNKLLSFNEDGSISWETL